MLEYITLILQIAFVAVIAAYIGKRLFFLCLDARRDHLLVRLAEVECDILESRSKGSIEAEYSDYMLKYTKQLRATDPDVFILSMSEFIDKVAKFPEEQQKFAVDILHIQLLFLATKSMLVFVIIQILKKMEQDRKKDQRPQVYRTSASPLAETARFVQAAFSPMHTTPILV